MIPAKLVNEKFAECEVFVYHNGFATKSSASTWRAYRNSVFENRLPIVIRFHKLSRNGELHSANSVELNVLPCVDLRNRMEWKNDFSRIKQLFSRHSCHVRQPSTIACWLQNFVAAATIALLAQNFLQDPPSIFITLFFAYEFYILHQYIILQFAKKKKLFYEFSKWSRISLRRSKEMQRLSN